MKRYFEFFFKSLTIFSIFGILNVIARIPTRHELYYPEFKQVVVWGHKLHSHTHSYIHYAFERAFTHSGYKTLWLDDDSDINGIDFSQSLFITEGQVDNKIPLRQDCWYILHNCDAEKYNELYNDNRCLLLQTFTHKCKKNNPLKIEEYIYYDSAIKMLYMPWATDLLPHEINAIKPQVPFFKKNNIIWYVGTVGGAGTLFGNNNEMIGFVRAAQTRKFQFNHVLQTLSMEENIKCIQESLLAPTIVGTWQLKEGYIPCRIFKNISYGNWGITNSKTVYEFFNKKIIFNEDTYHLFHDALEHISCAPLEELYELMDFVRDNHTYLNRIQHLLYFVSRLGQENI